MINLRPEICYKLAAARRDAGISQCKLAAELGCKQSAISMFEQGDGTKLNDETINKYASRFGIDIAAESVMPTVVRSASTAFAVGSGFCPNPDCPSNHKYIVRERIFLRPERLEADPVGGEYCAVCGELLERHCPECGRMVHTGAVCSYCGHQYVVKG